MSAAAENREQPPGLLLPLALVIVAFFLFLCFQTVQLVREREGISTLRANQETPLQEAQKLRSQLEAIAGATFRMAEQGDAGAKQVIEEMRRQGVNIRP